MKTPTSLNIMPQNTTMNGQPDSAISPNKFNFQSNINIVKPTAQQNGQMNAPESITSANIKKQLDDTRRYLRTQAFKPLANSNNSRIVDNRRNELIREYGKSSEFRI